MKIKKKINLFLLLTAILISLPSMAQPVKMAIIKGKLSLKNLPAEMALYSVIDGDVVLHSKVKVAKDSTFGFCFSPEYSGFYRIGERNSPGRIFISPGKQVSVAITIDDMINLNPADKENNQLVAWNKIIGKLKAANSMMVMVTYKDIFPILPEIEKQKDKFVATEKTGNPAFDKLLKGMAKAEFEYELYHFLFMPRTAHPKFEEHPELYKQYSSGVHFATTELLKYDFGMNLLSSYVQYLSSVKYNEGIKYSTELSEKLCQENVQNDTLKGWYLMNNQLLRSKAFDQAYRDKSEKFKPYILSDAQKKKLKDFEGTIRTFADGELAINFNGKTIDGKKVALSDFKGKVVLVDVWATWCGPCKKEIPSLQKLEEEMKGTDVVFMSYSVDEQKDAEKWKKMVDTEKLGGVQLMGDAAFKSSICVDYKINAIPRFMVFNKEGKIVTIDAPRPSNPELKTLLEKLIK
jgi:thiol-disulfide isomerase/thioredoxin